ncbi:MAG: aminotransferase class IV family protein [Pseudomonadota bacterium]|nr:aminotransferase class IV family protein [Pseudomonadota bacterium]
MPYCIVNGRLVPAEEACISIQDRGFRYGDGVFETISVHAGRPYQLDWHLARLRAGLSAIRIDFDVEGLRPHCRLLLEKNALRDGLLRIQVTRGTGSRGYLPMPSQASFAIETVPLPDIPRTPVALWLSEHKKISPRALPVRYKLCQGLNSTLARLEAADHDCADALMLNEQGHVCETSSGNIFWLKDGVLYTPALSCSVLEGSTRAAIMRLSDYPVQEVEAGLEALLAAEAVFITNVVWEAMAVNRLLPKDTGWQSDVLAEKHRRLLQQDKKRHSGT